MKLSIAAVLSISILSGCAGMMTKSSYDYDVDPGSKAKDHAGELQVTGLEAGSVLIKFTNVGSSSGKILWDDSAIVDVNGQTHKVIHNGIRFKDSGTAVPPTTVLPGASVVDGMSYADGIDFNGQYGWKLADLAPCSTHTILCTPDAYGKALTLLLTFESDGKRHEYVTKVALKKPSSM